MTKTLVAILLALLVMMPTAAHAAIQPNDHFFGMHHHDIANTFPRTTAVNSIRLWDSGVTWKDVEVSPGVYDWTNLDRAVANSELFRASVFLVLGGTPQFYAQDPNHQTAYGPGFCEEADLTAWKNYVTAVVTRYKGRINAYEPINELDILTFYCGTTQHAVERSKIVYNVVQRIDPAAIVTSPSFVDRLPTSQYEIMNYLYKFGGIKYAEAISYHPYGMPDDGPEQNASLVKSLRSKLAAKGITRPVWTTEINYGLPIGGGGVTAGDWSKWKQSAFMARTFLTQHDAKAKRVYWYSWAGATFQGVKLLDETNTPTISVKAMEAVRYWMRFPVSRATINKRGTWTMRVSFPGRDGFIKWNPDRTVYEAPPAGTLTKRNVYGTLVPYNKRVGIAPVLYR